MTGPIRDHDCDLCGSSDAAEIAEARVYTQGVPLHVCRACGFVYIRRRRSAQAIADSWSDELYGAHYTAALPAVQARQTFVAAFVDAHLGLAGKRVCDIGAGEGLFLDMIRAAKYGAAVFGVEPSPANGRRMDAMGIANFAGTVEAYQASAPADRFDIVTIIWTLENCQSCQTMLGAAWDLLEPGGHVVVATGSRILVPFKKPLQYYLGPGEQDTHCFRFSRNSLTRALSNSRFETVYGNRDIDNDVLCLIGRKTDRGRDLPQPTDDWRAVKDFFARWHAETQNYYADA